jgi:peptidoglycan-associated lipoprotein
LNKGVSVRIEGHCDERGSDEYNLALGEKRAQSVKTYMISLGVPAERMSIISYGEEIPLVMGHDEEAWAQNRRAEFKELN